ncbi:MAG: hypothetical protein K6G87_19385 [Butyrivibrio sp.]|uniref:hypothetical protein n=1 Tax=Butyrivibrio sp. TaxID=28121 RepID=UPI0025FC9C10|nr:hypothetical protein [Butyrivibrio sp.]MCR5773390.1 hypothetical protein [Butyrivibrio sp.]
MFDRMLGYYLVEQGRLTGEQIDQVYDKQAKSRARLGVIAVAEKLMSIPQAEQINSLQATHDKYFGDLAIEMGYLTPEQVTKLLSEQGNEFMAFSQAIVDLGFMSLDEIAGLSQEYANKYGLMESEIDALKCNDFSRIVPIFTKDADEKTVKLLTIAVKNVYRLIDQHVTIGQLEKKETVSGECVGYQKTIGRDLLCNSISGSYTDLQKMAMSYTKEEFIETREDALDALCEFINCTNGIYATQESTDGEMIDLEPPIYITHFANIKAPVVYSLPVYCSDATVYINISDAGKTEIG